MATETTEDAPVFMTAFWDDKVEIADEGRIFRLVLSREAAIRTAKQILREYGEAV